MLRVGVRAGGLLWIVTVERWTGKCRAKEQKALGQAQNPGYSSRAMWYAVGCSSTELS